MVPMMCIGLWRIASTNALCLGVSLDQLVYELPDIALCSSRMPPAPSHSWEMLSMITTAMPDRSHSARASLYFSGLKGDRMLTTLYPPRWEYNSALRFSVSMTTILDQSLTRP